MTLHFFEYGSGHPLIILHGLLGSLDNWHTLSKAFSASFRVFTIDQRNHGRSPHSDIFTYRAMAEDLVEFVDSHHLSSVHVLGHSMGGKTAMQFALSYPDRVNALIVVDIAPRAYPDLHDEILSALLALDLSAYTARQEVDAALAGKIPDIAVRQFLLKNLSRDAAGAFHWRANLRTIHEHYAEIARGIESTRPFTKPTLFIRSSRSGYVREGDIVQIRSLFPAAEVVDIAGGHWLHAEAPGEFSRAVLDFLSNA